MDQHGQVRPPTDETVSEMSVSEFTRNFDRLSDVISTLSRQVQDIIDDLRAEQEEERDHLSHGIIKRKFRRAMREHDREAQ